MKLKLKQLIFTFFFIAVKIGFVYGNIDTVKVKKYANVITASNLKTHLTELASEKYEGRETGEEGQRLAAKYLANYYQSLGLAKIGESYFQDYPISQERAKMSSITFNNSYFTFLKDYYFFPRFDTQELIGSEIIFCGYGIKDSAYNDYANLNVKYKVIVILNGEPKNKKGEYLITKTKYPSDWSGNIRLKLEAAREQGANAVFIIDEKIEKNIKIYRHSIEKPLTRLGSSEKLTGKIPYFFISTKMANKLLTVNYKKLEKQIVSYGKPVQYVNKGNIKISIERDQQNLLAQNVLAYIPGTDKKDEYVVFSAHYDHLGIQDGKIYFGADDDGSGTVAVLELAKAFYEAYKNGNGPRRSLLFINFSGEEKGLLGSEYYAKNPVVPLNKTVCDLNIDMIGRIDKEHNGNPDYVYIIGSDKLSSDLHNINEEANKLSVNLTLDYTYNKPSDPNRFYYRSDHYNFAKNNVPVIFYFTGVHEDYHKPTDTVDKIDFYKMEKITRLIFYTAWEIANREEKLKVDKVNDFKNSR